MSDTIQDRVAKGVELLDSRYPDWRGKINVGILDMQSPRYCVLGQIYGDYYQGLIVLDIPTEAPQYGFSTYLDETASLKDAWISLLQTPN